MHVAGPGEFQATQILRLPGGGEAAVRTDRPLLASEHPSSTCHGSGTELGAGSQSLVKHGPPEGGRCRK